MAASPRFKSSGDKKDIWLILHLRNYGASPAKETLVELWPVIHNVGEYVIQKIRPFDKTFKKYPRFGGIPVAPGFPFDVPSAIDSAGWALVNAPIGDGTYKAQIDIIGRISYRDRVGVVCQPFTIDYSPALGFRLSPTAIPDICDGAPHEATFYAVHVGPKATRVWPPTGKPRIITDQ